MTMNAVDRETAIGWLRHHAHPLTTLDPNAPIDDLRALGEMVRHATVVGFGASTRFAHEFLAIQYRVLRFLVEELGFRTLALEEDWTKGIQIDEYVRTGTGDPKTLLSDAWIPWQTGEVLDALRWIRSYNQQHPTDSVRVVGIDFNAVQALAYDPVADYVQMVTPERLDELESHYTVLRPTSPIAEHVEWYQSQEDKQPLIDHARKAYDLVDSLPAHNNGRAVALQYARVIVSFYEFHACGHIGYVEQHLAENMIWWHEHTAHKIVYWGGIAHAANGNPHTLSFPPSASIKDRSAGSYLRDRFGASYVSIGLTFDRGSVPYPVQAPSPEFAESAFSDSGLDIFTLDLHAPQPDSIREWLNAPTKTRLIGPHYNLEHDADYHMSGGSLASWFDIIIHFQETTPAHPLT
jgi:erythromycin esterase